MVLFGGSDAKNVESDFFIVKFKVLFFIVKFKVLLMYPTRRMSNSRYVPSDPPNGTNVTFKWLLMDPTGRMSHSSGC